MRKLSLNDFNATLSSVSCVKFNKDLEEQLVWSAGRDGKIKQWNAQKFDKIQTLNGHFSEIRALAQTSDGNTLVAFLFNI
jgi:U3 small nucleolar RNA-associated protein 12